MEQENGKSRVACWSSEAAAGVSAFPLIVLVIVSIKRRLGAGIKNR